MSELVKNRCNDCDKEIEALRGAHVWCGTCGHLMKPFASESMEEMSNG
jgi:DNA-directed RNA polymerase subunit RPC12/RpoP